MTASDRTSPPDRRTGPGLALIATLLATTLLATTLPASRLLAQDAGLPPYRDASLPTAERVADLLGRMTLEEKFWQLYMSPGSLDDPSHDWSAGAFGLQIDVAPAAGEIARAHAERINAIQRWFVEETRLGIPIIAFDEALHGLMRPGATSFPQAIGLAATWDTALVGRVARAVAAETRSRGVRQALSPVVNIVEDVRWGRVEETYGEDPYLSSVMARAFVGAFEAAGVITTPKHFVANVGAGGRDSYPIHLSERFLAEEHFPPFRAALEAGARSVMTAYNSVDGLPATQSPWLLNETLKRDWGFTGFVISDMSATGGATVLHMTEPSTPVAAKHAWEAGLDVVFQSRWGEHRPYLAAVRDGLVAGAVIDSAVARVLRAKIELGLFEDPYVDPAEAARLAGHPDHRALAREAARSSLVLLKNDDGALPLAVPAAPPDPGAPAAPVDATLAVIGTDAVEARLGGYSGPGIAPVSILDGIRERAGAGVAVRYAPGPGRAVAGPVAVPAERLTGPDGAPGLAAAYWSNPRLEGEPAIRRRDEAIDFAWTLYSPGRGLPFDWYSARWTGRLEVPAGGVRRLGVTGSDGWRLWLDGALLIDNWTEVSHRTLLADVDLAPGSVHDLRLEFHESTGRARLRLVWDAGVQDPAAERIAEAVAAAEGADAAIVVAGIEEGEFRDRASLGLPGAQAELIRRVAATGTPTVVVLVAGSAVTMSPWLHEADAVLAAWYPGEAGGRAVADVLFGDADPAGRLPITFPVAEGQLPLTYRHRPTGRGDDYLDLTGQPLFPFGFGLSYATFEYAGLEIEPAAVGAAALEDGGQVTVRLRVRNTSGRPGTEVIQLYIRDELASVARPVMELAGFRKVRLAPGEEREVSFTLGATDLEMLDAALRRVVEPGAFRVLIGRSAADIRLRARLEVRAP